MRINRREEDLEFVEAQCEVEDLGELPGQGLLLLQVLRGGAARPGERHQEGPQGTL